MPKVTCPKYNCIFNDDGVCFSDTVNLIDDYGELKCETGETVTGMDTENSQKHECARGELEKEAEKK